MILSKKLSNFIFKGSQFVTIVFFKPNLSILLDKIEARNLEISLAIINPSLERRLAT